MHFFFYHDYARHTGVEKLADLERLTCDEFLFSAPTVQPRSSTLWRLPFSTLKEYLSGHCYASDNEVQATVRTWLQETALYASDNGMQQLVPRLVYV